ncbi:polyprenol phosphomannose-dependent alpha 1,6 mannosyltransferase MptB [Micrococcus sp.]|uniref:polyprenol phosphomannose-dependent alpha 1,6 mannosyltransferase MptB n=1 Tax=Micrococcus sp. TaxID=1271 RepID=UPI002A9126DF|nr:polyprenol phosphomannose-dependent alpha 1,6 mannosyltransferase MptB [Micrococcus sp.]MDY6054391.1 polyprenol phosphomannose-dependent alpha 1,6 mannosyltransferase MptB [Micrococcus sp.]
MRPAPDSASSPAHGLTPPPAPAPTARQALREGALAAWAVVVASWGVGWLPLTTPSSVFSGTTILTPLRVGFVPVTACAVLLAVGSLLMVRAWLRLGRALQGRWEAAGPVVRRAAWAWSLPFLLAFPVFSRDVYSYLQQGRLLSLGLDPYQHGVSALGGWFMHGADSIWAESPSPYGPLFLVFATGVWRLTGGQVELSVTLFRLLALAGLALCLWALPRLAEASGRSASWAVWVCLVNPLFLLYMVAGVHNDSLMTGLMLVGLVLLMRAGRRRVLRLWGLVAVALSVAIKPLTVLALPFVAMLLPTGDAHFRPGTQTRMRRRERIGPWITTAAVALAVMTILGAGTGLWFGWVPAMATSGSAAFPYAPVGLLGLGLGWAVDAVSTVPARTVASGFYTLMIVAALGFTVWMALRRTPRHPVYATALCLLVAVVAAPIIQPWYFLWVMPLLACAPRPLPGTADHPRWLGWVTAAAALALIGAGVVDQLSVAQWLPLALIRCVNAVVVLVGIWWIVRRDASTAPLFPRGRGRPPRETIEPRRPLPAPAPARTTLPASAPRLDQE